MSTNPSTPIHARHPASLANPFILNHKFLLSLFAHYIKPEIYLEFGVASGEIIETIAQYSTKAIGVDINAYIPKASNIEFHQCKTQDFDLSNLVIDMAFIDADHDSNVAFADFEKIYPHLAENAFCFIHDTFPTLEPLLATGYCADSWKVPDMIKSKYPSDEVEVLTIPVCPGLTIVRKVKLLDFMV